MAIAWKDIRKKIYGIIGSSDIDMLKVKMYDEHGNRTIDPSDTNRFFIKIKSSDPNIKSFTVLCALRDEGQLSHVDIKTPEFQNDEDFNKIYDNLITSIRKNVGDIEGIKVNWSDYDRSIDPKEEAMNNIKESKDIGKISGTTKSSFQRIGNSRMIIRHTDVVNEEKHGARTRHIKAIFVENSSGERFSYPFPHLIGARAFARHISNGGNNHDDIAKRIYSLSEDYFSLRRAGIFLKKSNQNHEWISSIQESMRSINRNLKSMHGPKGYSVISERLLGESTIDESLVENLKKEIIETCQCNQEDPVCFDIETAARYITGMPKMTQPMVFTWSRKPDISSIVSNDSKERMYHQIMELSDACTDESVVVDLCRIAEMISKGIRPSDTDLDTVKEALISGLSYEPEQQILQEQQELDGFFSLFKIENIFKK